MQYASVHLSHGITLYSLLYSKCLVLEKSVLSVTECLKYIISALQFIAGSHSTMLEDIK